MDNQIVQGEQLGIDPQIATKLTSFEDFLAYYIQLSQTHDTTSWIKADLLVQMQKKLGKSSLVQLSKTLKQPASTTSAYVRVAKAFPVDRRDEALSFTVHLKASYSDDYDEKTGTFLGEERFHWLEKAADNAWASRKLEAEILDKKVQKRAKSVKPCVKCGSKEKIIKEYIIYPVGVTGKSHKFFLDEDCFIQLLTWIYGKSKDE